MRFEDPATGAVHRLPFVVGVMGGFAGDKSRLPLARREFMQVDRVSFDAFMTRLAPELDVAVDSLPPRYLSLVFRALSDFLPENLDRQLTAKLGDDLPSSRSPTG